MKLNRIKKRTVLLVITVMLMVANLPLTSFAGSSEMVIDSSSFAETIDSQVWNDVDGDIEVDQGVLVFPKESTESTGLIAKKIAQATGKHENIVNAQASVQFTQLPKNEKFAFALGLQKVSSSMGEAKNIEITFVNNNGLKVFVVAYDEDGNEQILHKETPCGSIGSTIKVAAKISEKGFLTVHINGKPLCTVELPTDGRGRVGFVQTGSCGARVKDVEIVTYKYENPENVNIFEDFEEGTLNTNTLVSKSVVRESSYVDTNVGIVKKEDGNHVFEALHASPFYIGAIYQYSNFELTFDVVSLQKTERLNEKQEVISPATTRFAISFGGETPDAANYHYVNASDLLIFSHDSSISSLYTGNKASAIDKGYPFFSKDVDKPFTVKLSVIDSVITVSIKWMEETNFTEVLKYQISRENPLGYVHVWSLDMGACWAIDNFKLENKDVGPQLIETEFASELFEMPEDFEYAVEKQEYKEQKVDNSIYFLIPVVATACLICLIITVIITQKKTKKKGDVGNEQRPVEKDC